MSEKPHIVKSYEEQLQLLKDTIVKMGTGVEKQLENTIQSLVKKDISLAEKSIKDDELTDKYEINIEEQVVNLIALRQPMAIDLRETVVALKVSSDLERIGDLAKNISKRLTKIGTDLPNDITKNFEIAGLKASKQVNAVLNSYLHRDKDTAENVWNSDEEIDQMTNSNMEAAVKHLEKNQNDIQKVTQLLFMLKNIERIGDHATNIAEQVYFLITGDYLEGDRPKG
jgi:phosphate transport system protein